MQISDERMEILAQGFVAFGAGAQGYRVSRDACRVLHGYFLSFLTHSIGSEERLKHWDDPGHSSELLDMVFVVGKLSAQIAAEAGDTAIHDQHVRMSVDKIQRSPRHEKNAGICDITAG
jgi:hypothetical protein